MSNLVEWVDYKRFWINPNQIMFIKTGDQKIAERLILHFLSGQVLHINFDDLEQRELFIAKLNEAMA